jgi:predicted nucleic acid-binding Zn ribbon protein
MSSTLLRLGLWVILIVVVMYVIHETYEGEAIAEYVPMVMMQKALAVGGILVIAGIVARMFEKASAKVLPKNRCATCRTPIAPGAIYCRAHLRSILAREDDRTHMTRLRR